MRILAIDVGEKKIGLAVGDTLTGMAFTRPALLVMSWSEVWKPLQTLCGDEQIEQVVIGWPMNTDGTTGAQASRVDDFIQQATAYISIPMVKRDERNTSQAVQREQKTAGQKLARGEEDSLAAQLLLETYLMEKR